MSYKKFFTVIAALILSVSAFAQNNTIAVPVPKTVNLGEGNDWIPLFFQGMITSNFQQFSGFNVVDRQNADMVKAEQKLSENAEFDEKNSIELGKMTNARLIITGSITGKNSSYALMFSITDTETGETKASTTIPNCLYSALENGDAANQISYELMKGYGINLSSTAQSVLTKKASVMTAETTAQVSVAKGIVAEKSGANIEALTYYIQAKKNDKKLNEATSRMASMTNVVTGGNFGANAKNMIKLRNDWDKLLKEAAALIASNPPEFTLYYFSNIKAEEMTAEDYERGTMSFTVGSPYLKQTGGFENEKIANELLDGLHKIPESKNWGEKINNFPWSYADDIPGNNWLKLAAGNKSEMLVFTMKLLDAKKKTVATKDITYTINYGKQYSYNYGISKTESHNYGISETEGIKSDNCRIDAYYSYNPHYAGELAGFTFNQVNVNDADTDSLYLTVNKKAGRDTSILPVPYGVLSILDKETIQSKESVTIGGVLSLEDYEKESWQIFGKKQMVDLSGVVNTYIKFWPDNDSINLLVLPEGLKYLKVCGKLKGLVLPRSLRDFRLWGSGKAPYIDTIYYCGTSEHAQYVTLTWNFRSSGGIEGNLYEADTSWNNYTKIVNSIIYNYDLNHAKNVDAYEAAGGVDSANAAQFIASINAEDQLNTVNVTGEVSNADYIRIIAAVRENKNVESVNWSKATGTMPDYFNKGGVEGKNAAAFIKTITKEFDIETVKIIGTVSENDYTAIDTAFNENKSVRYGSFMNVKSLTLPDGVTSVPTFRGSKIVIPTSVKKIFDNGFGNDNSPLEVYYRGNKKEWKAITVGKDNKALKNAKIVFDYQGE